MKRKSIINGVCIALAILFISISAGLGFNVLRTCAINDGFDAIYLDKAYKELKFTESSEFMYTFIKDLDSVAIQTKSCLDFNNAKTLKKNKNQIINSAYNQFLKEKAKYIEDILIQCSSSDYYDDYNNYLFSNKSYTVPKKQIRDKVTYDEDAPKFIRDIQKIVNGTKGLGFLDYSNLIRYDEDDYEINIDFDGYSNSIPVNSLNPKIDIGYALDDCIQNLESNYDYDYNNDYTNHTSFKYYIKNNKTNKVYSNLKNGETAESLAEKDIHYLSLGGKVTSKGLKCFMEYYEYKNIFSDNFDCYIAIDTENASNDDIYVLLKNYCDSAKNQNFSYQFTLCIILCVLSIALAVYVFVNVSKKRIFIDYLFTDIHLVVSGFIATMTIMPIIYIFSEGENNSILYTNFLVYAIAAVCGVVFAILCEFFCSLIRVCKSEKKLLDNCFIFIVLRWIFRKIKLLFKKIFYVIGYRSNEIKRSTIPFVALTVLIDAILILMLAVVYDGEIKAFIMFVLAGFNLFVAYKIIRYLISLDKVITCAKNRDDFVENVEKLPKSLQVLQDSMKYTNEELRQAVEKAVKDERLRTELITNVSHDLKTPLTSIITYVDLLDKCDINDEKAKEYISVLNDKGLKLKRLIDDLLEASKVSSGNITLNLTNINLPELVVQAVGEFEEDFSKQNLEIKTDILDNKQIIFADGNKTFRVIENLLSNAKKYSAKGTRVYVSVYSDDENGIFEIKNVSAEPLNISPDELTERFVRGDKSRTNEGNGLGLSIAKELCIAMGGKLKIIIDGDLFKAKVYLPKK